MIIISPYALAPSARDEMPVPLRHCPAVMLEHIVITRSGQSSVHNLLLLTSVLPAKGEPKTSETLVSNQNPVFYELLTQKLAFPPGLPGRA
jgi:hypothetical protein